MALALQVLNCKALTLLLGLTSKVLTFASKVLMALLLNVLNSEALSMTVLLGLASEVLKVALEVLMALALTFVKYLCKLIFSCSLLRLTISLQAFT